MSFAEIKQAVAKLSPHELEELAAHIAITQRLSDPEWLARIAKTNAEMDAGHSYSEADLLRIHEDLARLSAVAERR